MQISALREISTKETAGVRQLHQVTRGLASGDPELRYGHRCLGALGLDADQLLTHGIGKCLYGVPLARNLRDYLLARDETGLPFWLRVPKRIYATHCRLVIQALGQEQDRT